MYYLFCKTNTFNNMTDHRTRSYNAHAFNFVRELSNRVPLYHRDNHPISGYKSLFFIQQFCIKYWSSFSANKDSPALKKQTVKNCTASVDLTDSHSPYPHCPGQELLGHYSFFSPKCFWKVKQCNCFSIREAQESHFIFPNDQP